MHIDKQTLIIVGIIHFLAGVVLLVNKFAVLDVETALICFVGVLFGVVAGTCLAFIVAGSEKR